MNNNIPKVYDQLDAYIQKINQFTLLTKDQEFSLAKKLKDDGSQNSAMLLINSNLRFVVKIAYQYKNYGFKLSDLIQEGNYGLIMAVKKFDPEKGYRLITYAVWWIKAYIKNYIINNWSLIKVGTTQAQKRLFFKLKEEMRKNEILMLKGGDVEIKLIADKFQVKESEIIEMDQRISSKDFYLDAQLSDDKGTTHIDLLSTNDISIEDKIIDEEQLDKIGEKLKEVYKILKDVEKTIFEERLIAEYPKTLQELGEQLGISRERVRQLEVRTKNKIKKFLETECDYTIEV
ncbi:RNA polymerase factor sigma-32 [bacterium]|nr:RNA polymerase factor sigma-32 [bacterium]